MWRVVLMTFCLMMNICWIFPLWSNFTALCSPQICVGKLDDGEMFLKVSSGKKRGLVPADSIEEIWAPATVLQVQRFDGIHHHRHTLSISHLAQRGPQTVHQTQRGWTTIWLTWWPRSFRINLFPKSAVAFFLCAKICLDRSWKHKWKWFKCALWMSFPPLRRNLWKVLRFFQTSRYCPHLGPHPCLCEPGSLAWPFMVTSIHHKTPANVKRHQGETARDKQAGRRAAWKQSPQSKNPHQCRCWGFRWRWNQKLFRNEIGESTLKLFYLYFFLMCKQRNVGFWSVCMRWFEQFVADPVKIITEQEMNLPDRYFHICFELFVILRWNSKQK